MDPTNRDERIQILRIRSEVQLNDVINANGDFGYFVFCNHATADVVIDHKTLRLKGYSVLNIVSTATFDITSLQSESDLILVKYHERVKNVLSTHSLGVFCPGTGLLQMTLSEPDYFDLLFHVHRIERVLPALTVPDYETALLNLILIVKDLANQISLDNAQRRVDNTTILSFINLLDKNYQSNKTLDFYCAKLGITSKTLYRAFKENIGISPKEFVNAKLTTEAQKLLIHSNLSIKEIAGYLGFQSQYYFANFFKKASSLTPSAYREEMSESSILLS